MKLNTVILQVRKLGLREARKLTQGHTWPVSRQVGLGPRC